MKHFWSLAALFGAFLCLTPHAYADIALLLEEPYRYDGAFAGMGHAALYLTRVCASSPTVLRSCAPGESGVVISRYAGIAGYDWLAIPLIPYLYATERSEGVPLIADARIVAALRDRYRRRYLRDIAPDTPSGAAPAGNWYELIGSAYDRTLYAFELETTTAADDAFINTYNARPNRDSYNLVTRNCADFVREAVNFYYPHVLGRSVFSDWAISTPMNAAKSFVKFSTHHPELRFSAFVIPQVPGSIKRSKPVHGIVQSLVKAKKYWIPLFLSSPVTAVSFAAVHVVSGPLNPARNAMVFSPDGRLEPPLTAAGRRAHCGALMAFRQAASLSTKSSSMAWKQFQSTDDVQLDEAGLAVVRVVIGGKTLEVGITRGNVLGSPDSRDMARELLLDRIGQNLRRSHAPKISQRGMQADWRLLHRTLSGTELPVPINDQPTGQ